MLADRMNVNSLLVIALASVATSAALVEVTTRRSLHPSCARIAQALDDSESALHHLRDLIQVHAKSKVRPSISEYACMHMRLPTARRAGQTKIRVLEAIAPTARDSAHFGRGEVCLRLGFEVRAHACVRKEVDQTLDPVHTSRTQAEVKGLIESNDNELTSMQKERVRWDSLLTSEFLFESHLPS